MSVPKLTYFNIEGVAERVRLAFALTEVEFTDNRLSFQEWPEFKKTTPNGQVPVLTLELDGKETTLTQSGALARFVLSKYDKSGTAYPTSNPSQLVKVEEAVGIADDLIRAWSPSLYVAMYPGSFGYPADISGEEKDKVVKSIRENFVANIFPQQVENVTRLLKKNNDGSESTGFLAGEHVTLADLVLLPQLRYFGNGVADHVPKDLVAKYPVLAAYTQRLYAVPQIKKWYKL